MSAKAKKTSARVVKATQVAAAAASAARRLAKPVVEGARHAVKGGLSRPSPPPPGPGDWLTGVAAGAGGMRAWQLYRPPGTRFGERLPVLVMLHGCGQDAAGFARSCRMNKGAQREHSLVLYPEQSRLANGQRCWNWFETESGHAQAEAALILQAVDQVCLLHGGDRRRVAVAGLSAGASMAALLASRYPTRFAAVAMCAGVAPGLAHSTATALRAMRGRGRSAPPPAERQDWPPLLVIQGQADRVVVPANGRQAAEQWAQATGAMATAPRRTQRGQRHPATVTDYRREGRTLVSLVEVEQLGHAWSGGPASLAFSDPKGPDASSLVWRFVAKCWAEGQ